MAFARPLPKFLHLFSPYPGGRRPSECARLEFAAWLAGFALFIYVLRELLIYPDKTFAHDHIFWGYPAYHYFASCMLNGDFPYWNPYSHGGEPFYPTIVHSRFLDPNVLVVLYVGRFITNDLMLLYNWTHVMQFLVMALGTYGVLRPIAKRPVVRLSLIPLLLFSSFSLGTFRQPGFLHQFAWVPFVAIFAIRILFRKDYRWVNWLALSGFMGLTFQSYFFTGLFTAGLFFFSALAYWRRDLLLSVVSRRANWPKVLFAAVVLCAFAAPNWALMSEKGDFVFPARRTWEALEKSGDARSALHDGMEIEMSYETVMATGARSTVLDFVGLVAPGQDHWYLAATDRTPRPQESETLLYVGMLTWILALLGMVFARHTLRKPMLVVLAGTALVMLGASSGGAHEVLFNVYPPLWYLRNTHSLALIVVASVLYFYILGFEYLLSALSRRRLFRDTARRIHAITQVALVLAYGMLLYDNLHWLCVEDRYFVVRYIRHYEGRALSIMGLTLAASVLFRYLGRKGFFLAVLVAPIGVAMALSEFKLRLLGFLIAGAALPLLAIWRVRAGNRSRDAVAWVSLLIVAVLMADLGIAFGLHSGPLRTQPHLSLIGMLDTRASAMPLPPMRKICGPTLAFRAEAKGFRQGIRYPELLTRTPVVFSPQVSDLGREAHDRQSAFADARRAERFNSFFLRRNYYDLIHSEWPASFLEESFAVAKPQFQFKSAAVVLDGQSSPGEFAEEDGRRLLASAVVLNRSAARETELGELTAPLLSLLAAGSKFLGGASVAHEEIRMLSFGPNRVEAEAVADRERLLYWSNGYDPRWAAYVNGEPTPVYCANLNFMALRLLPGRSMVSWEFDPWAFRFGMWAFYFALVISCGGAFATYCIGACREHARGHGSSGSR
ncbi:MAG: YfhO family protein [Planctomycetota bacterium]|nr:YfhO family protein [Planctomycetota bacterium]